MSNNDPRALEIICERFGHDSLIAIATTEDGAPYVRAVNAYYEDGSFYVVTHALSNKMRQIGKNPRVAICGDWFTAQGAGENMGHVLAQENAELIARLREVFSSWYSNGHVNEADPNTCILRIRLLTAVLASNGTWYNVDFGG